MCESVRVVARCRPLSIRESELGCKCVVSVDHEYNSCSVANPADESLPQKTFTFDGVYDHQSRTEEIYNESVYPLIEGVLDGYNSTIFAYGQTGCGKSFTMHGSSDQLSEPGITSIAIDHIFDSIALAENTKYLVLVSYLEIYNDEIRDLLGSYGKRKLELKEHAENGMIVQGLSLHSVQSVHDCTKLLQWGNKTRVTAETQMNYDSSRSHSIFTIQLEIVPLCTSDDKKLLIKFERIKKGKLNLVDLAGSERQTRTGSIGDRLKEATKINLSLSALGNVISALVDAKSKYIPYRDSKLTRLLQDSLGGNTKTLMVACISPANNSYEETVSTLRYASRAKYIKNKPRINEDPKDTMLREYQEEIMRLRQILESNSAHHDFNPDQQIEEEKEKLRLEYEEKLDKLKKEWEAEHISKCQLQKDMEILRNNYENELMKTNKVDHDSCSDEDDFEPRLKTGFQEICSVNFAPDAAYMNIVDRFSVIGTFSWFFWIIYNTIFIPIMHRLKKLEKQMVGGERKNDVKLKERHTFLRRQLHSPHSSTIGVLSNGICENALLFKVCDDVQQQIDLRTEALKESKNKVQVLESENKDLHKEIENERKYYLEIISTLCHQLKLYKQITEKIVPSLQKDCNYSNLNWVINKATWIEEDESWKLPDLTYTPLKLPQIDVKRNWTSSSTSSASNSSAHHTNFYAGSTSSSSLSSELNETREESKIRQRLQRSEEENIAGNYFKFTRAIELLNKAKLEGGQPFRNYKFNNY